MSRADLEYYKSKIALIDTQHQGFFEIHNKIVSLIKDKKNVTDADILKILGDLTDYLKLHFKTEEDLFAITEYPDITKHIREHIYFIDKIDDFTMALKYKNPLLLENMLVFMKKWFMSHIRKTDSKYISIINEFIRESSDNHEG